MGAVLEAWRAEGGSTARSPERVEMLCKEIPDDGLAGNFRREAQGLLPG